MKLKNPFIHGTLLIKKSVFNECGNYDENFYFAQDYKLFLEIIKKGFKVKSLREPLYYLNMKDNISSKFQSEQEYYFACAKKGITPAAQDIVNILNSFDFSKYHNIDENMVLNIILVYNNVYLWM